MKRMLLLRLSKKATLFFHGKGILNPRAKPRASDLGLSAGDSLSQTVSEASVMAIPD